MDVVEDFESIQGEGITMGLPSYFIRLRGCNLQCKWCDSKYAWAGDFWNLNVDTVYECCLKAAEHGIKNVVVTGGEPLLQQEQLDELFCNLLADHFTIEVETNGTIRWKGDYAPNLFNISPKLSSSGNYAVDLDLLEWYNRKFNCQFKFVIGSVKDFQEYRSIAKKIPLQNVVLMPEGTTNTDIVRMGRWLAKRVRGRERVMPRLHIYLYGNKRGV